MNLRNALRKPRRQDPQLLVIPNRDAVLAAFNRAQTYPLDLIAIELERSTMFGKPGFLLIAFTRNCGLNAQHFMPGDEVNPKLLVDGAGLMAQTLSAGARRAEDRNGRK